MTFRHPETITASDSKKAHAYEVYAKHRDTGKEEIWTVIAMNRNSAARVVRDLGHSVNSVNMVG